MNVAYNAEKNEIYLVAEGGIDPSKIQNQAVLALTFQQLIRLTEGTAVHDKLKNKPPTFGMQWAGELFALRERWYEANGGMLPMEYYELRQVKIHKRVVANKPRIIMSS